MNRIPDHTLTLRRRAWYLSVALCTLMLAASNVDAQTSGANLATATGAIQDGSNSAAGVPIQLRSPRGESGGKSDMAPDADAPQRPSTGTDTIPQRYRPGEFERHVQRLPGSGDAKRLGIDLINGIVGADDSGGNSPLVPGDYLLQPGDELALTLWGSVDADLRLLIDRSGRISIPRVGTVMVAGVRYAELPDLLTRRVGQVFKNFQLSVTLGQLRGIRVFVTGFVTRPGVVMVNSLSTLSQALLRAGGPAAAGSFRNVQLRRGRDTVATFDLYDLLLAGDRTGDRLLQPDDVIHVGPIGSMVALIGSVNRAAIFELKPGETISDVLRMAGGFSAVADTSRLALERMADRAGTRVSLMPMPASTGQALANGDVLRAFNAVDLSQSTVPQNKRVRVEGEVLKPGEYVLPPDSTLADALAAAGGLSRSAYLFGTEFNRESVRATQRQNYERALRDFETDLVRAPVTQRAGSADEAAALASVTAAGTKLLEKLRAVQPTGRLVLQLQPGARALPEMTLEDGDRLYIPPRPNTVGVFGSVFSAGSYLFGSGRTVGEYLRLAGGATRRADESSVFVVRANGTVRSSLADSNWYSRGNRIGDLPTEPGDTVFVPDEINRTSWVQDAKDWTQILYQFGLGIAGLKSAIK